MRHDGQDWTVHVGDSFDLLDTLDPESIDAVITDPPYGIDFAKYLGRDWDQKGEPAEYQEWCRQWSAKCVRLLKPGGHALSFSGARTYHRLAAGLEDAGLEIRDSIHWIYFNGHPKGIDVARSIDNHLGVESRIIGYKASGIGTGNNFAARVGVYDGATAEKQAPIRAPTSPEAKKWEGWNSALAPAHEPIVVARKPLEGTTGANMLANGTGAYNITATRIPYASRAEYEKLRKGRERPERTVREGPIAKAFGFKPEGLKEPEQSRAGRWPSNVILSHGIECRPTGLPGRYACVPGCPVDALSREDGAAPTFTIQHPLPGFKYVTKPGRPERDLGIIGDALNTHPTVKPVNVMAWLIRLVTPPGGVVLDPFAGSGSTGIAAILDGFQFIGIELYNDYAQTAATRIRAAKERPNDARRILGFETNERAVTRPLDAF